MSRLRHLILSGEVSRCLILALAYSHNKVRTDPSVGIILINACLQGVSTHHSCLWARRLATVAEVGSVSGIRLGRWVLRHIPSAG